MTHRSTLFQPINTAESRPTSTQFCVHVSGVCAYLFKFRQADKTISEGALIKCVSEDDGNVTDLRAYRTAIEILVNLRGV